MTKVKVPMDFGVENLQCPVHNNIDLLVSNDEVVRANSLILSYNSTVFYDLFFKRLYTSVDVSSFTKSSVDHFVKCLYSGKVNINYDAFRELIELADEFSVDWLIEQCDLFYMRLTDSIKFGDKDYIELEILKFSFDEAIHAPKRSRQKYKLKVKEKMSTMKVVEKRQFIQKYAAKYLYLSVNQLNAMLEFAKGHDGILLKIVQENLVRQRHHLDDKSVHILKGIDLDNCLESDSGVDTFNQLFGNTFIIKTQQERENLEKILDLGISATKRVLLQKPSLTSKLVSIKHNVSVQLPETLNYDESGYYDYAVSGSPAPKRNLICDYNIVEELHDPTSIPNLFSSLDSLNLRALTRHDVGWCMYRKSFYVEDILTAASTSPLFKNLYMVIELIATYGCVKRLATGVKKSDLESIVAKLVELKCSQGWKRVDPNFFDHQKFSFSLNILQSLNNDDYVRKHPDSSLRVLIGHCDDLVSVRDSVALVCHRGQIQSHASRKYSVIPDTIRMGEFLSSDQQTSIKRIYKFYWKHPNVTSCSNPKQCGFIINITPITGGKPDSFDVGLCTEVDDYPDDIHFHPEIMTAQKMHFVLRRDYNRKSSGRRSEMVYVSWAGKPIYHSNHVHWGGDSIDTEGYIALVVYYL